MKDASTSSHAVVISIICDRIEIQQSGRSERKILDRSSGGIPTDVAIMGNEIYIGASKYRIKGKEIQQIHHTTDTDDGHDDHHNNRMNRGRGIGTSTRGGHYRYAIRIDTIKNDMTFHLLSSFSIGSDMTEKKVWDRFMHRLQTLYNKYQRLLPASTSQIQQRTSTSTNSGPRYGSTVGKNNNNPIVDRSKPLQQQQRHPKRGVFGSQNVLLRNKQQQQQQRHRKTLLPETYETFSSDDDDDNGHEKKDIEEENDLAESTNHHGAITGSNDDDDDDDHDIDLTNPNDSKNLLDDNDSHSTHLIPTVTERKPRKQLIKGGKRLFKASNKNAMGNKSHSDDHDHTVESDDDTIFNTNTIDHDSSTSAITTPTIATQRLVSPQTTTTTTATTSIKKIISESPSDDDDNNQDKPSAEDRTEKTQKQQPSIYSFFQPRTYKKPSLSSLSTTDRSNISNSMVPSSSTATTTPTRTRTMTPTASSRRVPTTFVRNSGNRTNLPSKNHSDNNYDIDDDENTNWLLQSPVRKLRSPQEKRRYELFGTTTSTTKAAAIESTTTTQESIDVVSSSSSLSPTKTLLLSPGNRISLKNVTNNIHNNTSSNRINRLMHEDDPIEEDNSPRLPRTTTSNYNRSFGNNVNNNSNVNNGTNSSYRPLNFANITKRRRIAPTPLLNPFANSSSTPKGLLDFRHSESAIRTRTTTTITDNNHSDGASSSTTLYTPTPAAIYRKFRGLRNLGNTCYQNASLQMLYSCRHFMRVLQDLNGNGTNATTVGPITNCISTLGKELMKYYLPPVNPRILKDAMDTKTDKYIGYEQRDAHEFVSDLIDFVHEELEGQVKNNSGTTVNATDHTATLDQQPEPSVYLPTNDFCMTVQVGLKCCSCGYTRNKEEMYRHLSIDIVTDEDASSNAQQQEFSPSEANDSPVAMISMATVERSIQHFFQPETREIKCEKCTAGTHAEQTLQIVSRPKLLLLHLKRFIVMERKIYQPAVTEIDVGNHPPNIDRAGSPSTQEPTNGTPPYRIEYIFTKNKAPVVIPESLSLHEYHQLSSSNNENTMDTQERSYKLQSIVHHLGSRASSGHYTADAIRDVPPSEVISIETTTTTNPSLDEMANTSSEEITTKRDNVPPSQVWVSYDDGVTNETSMNKILGNRFKQSSAYMLLYSSE